MYFIKVATFQVLGYIWQVTTVLDKQITEYFLHC